MSQLADPIEQILENSTRGDGDLLLCRICSSPITSEAEKIDIGLTHQYRFTNPLGVTYSIGCYQNAPGCSLVGEATDDDSWFGGYRWQVALCTECLQHLGWYYQNDKQRFFFGLIPERLVKHTQGKDADH